MTTQNKYYIANVRIEVSTGGSTLTFLESYITDSKDVTFYSTVDNVEVSFIDFKEFDNGLLKQIVELDLATIAQLDITGGVEVNGYATEEE
ncbi:hypothetical protein [Psychrobacter sp. AOP31-A1-22]|uniref:hypothetical protein n=1 Tax=Psychrobacter sp. AOP31-A1-22 TaxID=3457696 RepID=UPI0040373F22